MIKMTQRDKWENDTLFKLKQETTCSKNYFKLFYDVKLELWKELWLKVIKSLSKLTKLKKKKSFNDIWPVNNPIYKFITNCQQSNTKVFYKHVVIL